MWSMGSPLSIVDCFIAGRSWSRADTLPIRIALPPREPRPVYQDRKDYARSFRSVTVAAVVFRISVKCTHPARDDRPAPSRRISTFLSRPSAMIYAIHFSVCHANVERRTDTSLPFRSSLSSILTRNTDTYGIPRILFDFRASRDSGENLILRGVKNNRRPIKRISIGTLFY